MQVQHGHWADRMQRWLGTRGQGVVAAWAGMVDQSPNSRPIVQSQNSSSTSPVMAVMAGQATCQDPGTREQSRSSSAQVKAMTWDPRVGLRAAKGPVPDGNILWHPGLPKTTAQH